MRTNSRSRRRGLVLAVLTLIVGMPELAKAQQSGLFPLAPIKRQRPPCDQEDPVYKIYKEKYFGYHPPCWRPFPAGWGCPSEEKPDVEKAFRERKLSTDLNAPSREAEDMQPADQPPTREGLPPLPTGRSPFEEPAPGGANPAAPRQAPKPTSPFDLTNPPTTPEPAPAAPRGAGRARPASPGIGDGSPELSAPNDAIPVSGARTSRVTRDEQIQQRGNDGPLLALPEVTLAPVAGADAAFGGEPSQTSADAAPSQTTPDGRAPRRGFLSGLFNNLGWNWTRR